jgi:acetyltransferase-like isoleucine patch superfamily enzyme
MGFISRTAVENMGFAFVGENVLISDRASLYNCSNIFLGNNSRIDDFCVLSAGTGGIVIGNYVHIGTHSSLVGVGKITLLDFSGISSRVSIYSSSDDYSGAFMTNPTVPTQFANVAHADVFLGKHVIVGSGSVILPGVTLEEGAAIGALSLVQKDCKAFCIYSGCPARFVKERKRDLLELAKEISLRSGE